MFHSRIVLAAATALAVTAFTVLPAAAFGSDRAHTHPTDCKGVTMAQPGSGAVLSEYRISSVSPYLEEQTHLKRTWKAERGATLRVEPRPGLTAQWLQFQLDQEVRALRENPAAAVASPLGVPGVQVRVSPGPDSFVVTIAARNRAGADAVLARARTFGQ
jgi:hypothetical protein